MDTGCAGLRFLIRPRVVRHGHVVQMHARSWLLATAARARCWCLSSAASFPATTTHRTQSSCAGPWTAARPGCRSSSWMRWDRPARPPSATPPRTALSATARVSSTRRLARSSSSTGRRAWLVLQRSGRASSAQHSLVESKMHRITSSRVNTSVRKTSPNAVTLWRHAKTARCSCRLSLVLTFVLDYAAAVLSQMIKWSLSG